MNYPEETSSTYKIWLPEKSGKSINFWSNNCYDTYRGGPIYSIVGDWVKDNITKFDFGETEFIVTWGKGETVNGMRIFIINRNEDEFIPEKRIPNFTVDSKDS